MKLKKQLIVVFTAIIAYIISLIPLHIYSFYLTIGFIPMVIIGIRFGIKSSILSSLLWGILTIITGRAEILTPTQGFIEYIIAFSFGGLCGLYSPNNNYYIQFKTIFKCLSMGVIARYIWHFIAGVIFWQTFMPKSINPYLYSAITNCCSAVLTIIVDSLILYIIYKKYPKIFHTKKHS